MKKVIAFLFLTLLSLPIFELLGIRIEIRKLKKQVKKEILAKLSKNETTTIKLSTIDLAKNSKIILHPNDNEIEVNGEMYDIISENKQEDSIEFVCHHDHKETSLKRRLYGQLANLIAQQPIRSEQTTLLFNFLKNLFFEDSYQLKFPEFLRIDHYTSFIYRCLLSDTYYSDDSPPPDFGLNFLK